MPQTKKKSRKLYDAITVVLWNVFIAVVLIIVIEFFFGIAVNFYYGSNSAVNYEAFSDRGFGKEYLNEVNSISGVYSPYIEYTAEPNFEGRFINTDERSLRKTINPCQTDDSIKVFVFGGSTVWGGIGDENTLPSLISKILCDREVSVEVTNFGESGYENTKEVIRLGLELRNGNIPDLVIFYDGVNEVYSAFQNGFAGGPQNLENRKAEFNTKDKLNIDGFVKYSNSITVLRGISSRIFGSESAMEEEKLNELGNEIIEVYFNNIRTVKALGREYGFNSYFFWQPISYFDKPLTDGEKKVTLENVRGLYESTYSKIPKQKPELNFFDISDVLGDVEDTVYIDFAHVNELGNDLIAEIIVEILAVKEERFK